MKRIILLIAIFSSFTALAQTPRTYRIEGIAQRFSTALGIPVKASSFFNTSSDTAIVFIDPSDTTTIHFKYKGVAKKLAASNIPWDSITAKPSNFTTTYALSNDVRDSVQNRVPYENATRSLVLGNYRLSARGLLGDTIYTRSSIGGVLANNSGQAIANYGAGGSVDISFNGFAGMDYNRSGSMSNLSFTPKVYTDSLLNLKSNITDSTDLLSKTVRTFGNQSGILGNKIFTNNITANSLIKASGTADQLLVANGDVQSKADIHNGAFTFDTTGRLLTIQTLGGGTYSVLIPRGTASGAECITALTSSKVGNLVTVFGDNGSSTTFSIRDADSSITARLSDSTLFNSGRWLPNRSADSIAVIRALANSKGIGSVTSVALSAGTGISISGSPITSAGTINVVNTAPDQVVTLTAGTGISVSGTYPNFTITNTSTSTGTVTSVGLTAPTGFNVSSSPITSAGTIGLNFASGYSLPTTASQSLWDVAYNKRLSSASLTSSTLTLTLGDASTVTTSVPTFNQNTTGTAGSLSAVLSKTLGGAGDVNGILKANGLGVVSAAVAGTDYVAPATLNSYLPLSAGSGNVITGTLYINSSLINSNATYLDIYNNTADGSDTKITRIGGGGDVANNRGANIDLRGNEATGAGNLYLNAGGSGTIIANAAFSGTSASFSGVGLFGGATNIDGSLAVQISTAGTGTARWFGANKNGGYGLLMGFNEATGSLSGVGSYIRNVSADPMYFYVNNSTLAMTIANTGNITMAGTLDIAGVTHIGGGGTLGKFSVNDGTNINLSIKVGQTDATAVMLNAYNDAVNANIPMEFRASSYSFTNGAATYSSSVTAPNYFLGGRTTSFAYNMPDFRIYNTSGNVFAINNYTSDVFSISSAGTATILAGLNLGGALSGTSASLSSTLTTAGKITSTNGGFYLQNSVANSSEVGLVLEGAWPWTKYLDTETSQNSYGEYIDGNVFFAKRIPFADRNSAVSAVGTNIYTLDLSTGAASYSSSVTANSFVKSGGTSSQYLMADGSVTTASAGTSGTYTPTITGVSNVASSTSNQAQYMRVGNVVTVSGYIEVDPTSGSTPTEFRISLPVATSWSMGTSKAGGVMAGLDGAAVGSIYADTATGTVTFRYTSSASGSNMGISFTFTYLIE